MQVYLNKTIGSNSLDRELTGGSLIDSASSFYQIKEPSYMIVSEVKVFPWAYV